MDMEGAIFEMLLFLKSAFNNWLKKKLYLEKQTLSHFLE